VAEKRGSSTRPIPVRRMSSNSANSARSARAPRRRASSGWTKGRPRHDHGRHHLEARQAVVARCRRRAPGHETRSGAAISNRWEPSCCRTSRATAARWCVRPMGSAARAFSSVMRWRACRNCFELVKVQGAELAPPYVQIDRVEALAASAQIRRPWSCHPWNCVPQ